MAIEGGIFHSLALRPDGTVVAWGANDNGQIDVPLDLSNVVAIAAGGYHSLALRSDGTVVAWGYNGFVQTNVPPGNVVAIAAGESPSLALLSDGTVTVWGNNYYGLTNAFGPETWRRSPLETQPCCARMGGRAGGITATARLMCLWV